MEQVPDFGVARRRGGIETGQRIELLALEDRSLGAGEGDVDAEVGRSLRDERLRREERVNGKLGPAASTHQVLLEQGVVDVVARISLVAGQVHRAVDEDRQVRVDLNETVEAALVPVVAAPRLVGDVFDDEALAGRQLDVLSGAPPAFGDRRLEHGIEPVAGNDEALPEGLHPSRQHAFARHQLIEPVENLLKVRGTVGRRHRVVKSFRLLVESHLLARNEIDARHHRLKLAQQIGVPQARDLIPLILARRVLRALRPPRAIPADHSRRPRNRRRAGRPKGPA